MPYAGQAGIDVPELSDLVHEKSMNSARFMKSIRARNYHGLLLAKVTVKPHTPMSLKSYGDKIMRERDKLRDVPNALGFERAFETETNAYLLRQWLYSSLYDRLSTRPFLEDIEKKWIAFQLLCALRDCHARDIYHGDIKTENILVTSWNWLYLTDFTGSFKPARLPDNNPALYSYFFDISTRRTCYIAPERFLGPEDESNEDDGITWAMDIFSAGCVIAELFLETPIFTLSQLYKYRRGEFDPVISHLSRIPDQGLREMLSSMLALEPEKRYSAEQYLEYFKGRVFPEYFYSFLHQYMELITDPSSGRAPISGPAKNLGEADERIDRIYFDFDKISYFLGYQDKKTSPEMAHFTPRLASLRNAARSAPKVRACDLLLAFAERLTDEAKLDRVLPYLMMLLNDEVDIVAIAALRSVTELLAMVTVITPVNAHVFPEYIIPRMQVFLAGASRLPSVGGSDAETAFVTLFDNSRKELARLFETHAKALVEDADASVRRAFLSSVPELCKFFGEAESNDIILTHLNTYLNDKDWMLKCAFFDTIVGIATYFGSTSLEEFNLPLMVQALTDPEEHVVQAALHSLAELANLGLLSRTKTWELIDIVGRFTMHPNIWIRESAAEYLANSTKHLSQADKRCIILPQIRPLLKNAIIPEFSELSLLAALKKPLSRTVFEQAMVWAQKTDKGLFWKSVMKQRQSTFNLSSTGVAAKSREAQPLSMSRVAKNEEDDQWLSRLRSYGMTQGDEFKLLVLREFIWRLSRMKGNPAASDGTSTGLSDIIQLHDQMKCPIQNILFDEAPSLDDPSRPPINSPVDQGKGPYTIADALLDASMTIDEPVGRRRRAAINSHRSRLSGQGDAISPRTTIDRGTMSPTRLQPGSPTDGRASFDESRRASSASRGRTSVRDDDASSQDRPFSTRRAIRPQSSALDLLNRKDTNRSIPETGTTETNAFGQTLDGGSTKKASHSYEGNDPTVLNMLNNMYIDNYPHDVVEFGPLVQPISTRKPSRGNGQGASEAWRPTGRLVATFAEHTGAINRIVPSPDHVFFITGGDDGCVKIWDSSRLERNISNRSRQTHKHAAGARVVALCFIECTHSFVSCATDGSVHIVKVDTVATESSTKYLRLRLLREYQLPPDEQAVWCTHYKTDIPSVLLLATNRSRVLAIDLRTMSPMYELQNPVHHGTPTCFVVDRKRYWLLLGTSHGVLDLWDLRFRVRLKSWGMPGKLPIQRLALHPSRGKGKWVCVAGGTGLKEVTVWDIEKTQCREIYRAAGSSSKDGPKEYEAWSVDEDKPEGMLGRFATNIEPSSNSTPTDRCLRAMVVGSANMDEQQRDVRYGYIITGGADKRLRFWDLNRADQSTVFSGLLGDDPKPVFHSQIAPNNPQLTIVTERVPKTSSSSNSSAVDTNQQQQQKGSSRNGDGATSSSSAAQQAQKKQVKEKPARHTVISAEQARLLRSHLDSVLDVAVLEVPYTMTISVDRMGVIFVFQ
ncbi:hypothetical protein PG994_000064 [Apiospora phragmitis]|uniref:non-specific serine/threonine protein kinase n=1 Tax=Apiospora phragmitis TaxID=2905665 RepID=A0ABR1X5B7_9PEZI